ncbi:MAG: glycosyl hydrolase-related protein [Anaerolineae bacterium]|jgi:alpha-mannosidase/mannosylglycerate hydrolase|nr:glycosyl hydrolase-related protein [Anaerolineae bacterium]
MTAPLQSPPLNALHVIPYLRWEREGHETFETRRARLLDLVVRLIGRLRNESSSESVQSVLFTGQTVTFEDIAAVRPDLIALLVVYNTAGRLEAGCWYVLVDQALVSGESLIRNLLTARLDAERYGLKLSHIAYMPEIGGQTAQLPQILSQFSIHAAYLHHGAPVVHLPFRWEALDGSSMLAISHDTPLRQNAALSVRDQRVMKPDGPFLWMSNFEANEKSQPQGISVPILQSQLFDYVDALRRGLTDAMRPALKGELRLQTLREGGYLFSGTLSTRIYLKQLNARLQMLLTYSVEPLLALAITQRESLDNLRALLQYSWRLVLKNQANAAIGGYGNDAVHEENEIRARQAEDVARHLLQQAIDGITASGPAASDKTYLLAWNPHNWPVKQVIETHLTLPKGHHPAQVIAPNGENQIFAWDEDTRMIGFLADVPAVGYAVYTVSHSTAPTPALHLVQRGPGNIIASSQGATLSADQGVITWYHDPQPPIADLLRFYDGGDAGDTFNYSPPTVDVIEQAMLVNQVQREISPVYERLIMRHRMRVAPHLRSNRQRERGVRLIELVTTTTFYDGMAGIYFHTAFTNNAEDHRLRAHLRTGVMSQTVLSDAAFAVIERKAQPEGLKNPRRPKIEGVTHTQPMLGVAAVDQGERAMALLARGLPEFEAIPEGDQLTLALTLVRSVGWISRDDLATRTAMVGPHQAVSGAQCQRLLTADYALMPWTSGDPAHLMRLSETYNAPLQVFQCAQPPEKRARSCLSIQTSLGTGGDSDGNGAILSAFKPPQTGRGWIVRLFNPTDQTVEVNLTPYIKPKYVRLVNLVEEPIANLEPDANGTVNIPLAPHKIVTLRFGFW